MPACASASPILRSAGISQIMQQEVQICKANLSSNLVELPCPLQVADRPEALGGFELGLQHIGSRSRAHIILEGYHHQSGDPQAVLPAAVISAGVFRPRSVRSKSGIEAHQNQAVLLGSNVLVRIIEVQAELPSDRDQSLQIRRRKAYSSDSRILDLLAYICSFASHSPALC